MGAKRPVDLLTSTDVKKYYKRLRKLRTIQHMLCCCKKVHIVPHAPLINVKYEKVLNDRYDEWHQEAIQDAYDKWIEFLAEDNDKRYNKEILLKEHGHKPTWYECYDEVFNEMLEKEKFDIEEELRILKEEEDEIQRVEKEKEKLEQKRRIKLEEEEKNHENVFGGGGDGDLLGISSNGDNNN